MNIAEYSIKNKVISATFALLLLIAGSLSFFKLGQLEFPEFTLKTALVVTSYPGATSEQVEEEVTLQLENAIQQMEQVKEIISINSNGMSQIMVNMKNHYRKQELNQIWDELRRRVSDVSRKLPSGAHQPSVIDDFGDVYGMLYSVTGDAYTNKEIANYLDLLRRELVLVPGVKKIGIDGDRQEFIFIEISRQKLANLGISVDQIIQLINRQNVVSNAGQMYTGSETIRISPTGEYQKIADLEHLLISDNASSRLLYLKDVATITRGYQEVPEKLYHFNGQSALTLGISFSPNTNVVDVGKRVANRLQELEAERPLGIEIHPIYTQPQVVERAVSDFLINLVEAVAIVIVVLLIFMGPVSGLLMGLNLLLTILGTFIIMRVAGINLQLISLGALIIALGMLVDNAIVITEGILVGMKRNMSKLESAKLIVEQTKWPLLGATIIAITAFAPIGLSSDTTGEFAGSLFWVLAISLLLSWITAITLTPFFCHLFLKETASDNQGELQAHELYKGWLFTAYSSILSACLRFRWVTLAATVAALMAALVGFGSVKQVFFPASTTPIYFVNYWLPKNQDIRVVEKHISELEQQVAKLDGVKQITSVMGQGATRFILTYSPEKQYSNYGQLIVEATDLEAQEQAIRSTIEILRDYHPEAKYKVTKMENGPSPAAKIEARFSGPDPDVLRQIAEKTMAIFEADPSTDSIRHDWQEQTKLIRPILLESQARKAGISKQNLDDTLMIGFSGKRLNATYREHSDLLPMMLRSPDSERLSPESINDLQIWSPEYRTYVPISQVVSDFEVEWENPLIMRRDRKRSISILAEPLAMSPETSDTIFRRLRPQIEAIPLPEGYELTWGGEYEKSTEAQLALFSSLPVGLLTMFLITLFLFNSVRKTLSIWLTVPLSVIGVTIGLLVLGAPFGFMALLGILSLSGMVIKNGIVLVEQINLEMEENKSEYEALIHASLSRVRPVSMAAITTMLGMIPLFFDAFFQSMAVTITFGLGFATVLTLLILPTLYATFYRIKPSGS